MKKQLFFLVIMAGTITMAHGQSDSTMRQATKVPVVSRTTQLSPSRGFIVIKSSEIPPALRQKLQSPDYKGWENVPLYRNPEGTRYSFQLDKTGSNPQQYLFDHEGMPLRRSP